MPTCRQKLPGGGPTRATLTRTAAPCERQVRRVL